MLSITREYYNASSELLRSDLIIMRAKRNNIALDKDDMVYVRELSITNYHGPASRVVNSIEINGTYDTIETSSGNFTWAVWTSPSVRCNMSDLPIVTDTLS